MQTVEKMEEHLLGASRRWWQLLGWGCALLLLLTAAAYWPALRCGFVWDDNTYVTDNLTLRSLHGLRRIWFEPGATLQYYPMVFTSFWIEYHLWKLQPFGYHLVNILLHALNAVLLWRVLRRLNIPGAWWAAAIFAVDPVTVESVAWITERKNVLSCLFYLLAVSAFFRFRPLTDGATARPWDWRFYPLVLGLFLCALFSKTVTCSLPAALLLVVWWKTGRVQKRDAAAMAPLFVFGAGLGFVTAWLEKNLAGADGAEWTLSLQQRCLLAGRVLWFYAGKLFWPHPLIFIYPHWEIDARAAWSYLFPLAALGVVAALWLLRKRLGTGPLVAVLFFAGTLVPALGFVDVYPFRFSFVADHFQYLASMGLFALVVGACATISRQAGQAGRNLAVATGAATLLGYGLLTWNQTHVYRNVETLWRDTLAKNLSAWIAQNNLGVALQDRGKEAEAQVHYEEALRLKPDYIEAHNNLGNVLVDFNRVPEAIGLYREAIRLEPNYADTHYYLGNALASQGKFDEAIAEYEQALRLRPDYADAQCNLGNTLLTQGQLAQAVVQYRDALRNKPDLFEAQYNLAFALARLGQHEEAIAQYRQALRLNPNHAMTLNNLARLLATSKDERLRSSAEAIRLASRACELTDDRDPVKLDTLAMAYADTGRYPEAIQTAQRAIDLAVTTGTQELAGEIRAQLELYGLGKPYRE